MGFSLVLIRRRVFSQATRGVCKAVSSGTLRLLLCFLHSRTDLLCCPMLLLLRACNTAAFRLNLDVQVQLPFY